MITNVKVKLTKLINGWLVKWKYDYSGGIEPVIKFKNSGIPWYIFLIYSFKMDRCYNG